MVVSDRIELKMFLRLTTAVPDNVFRYHVRSFEADETGILIEL